MTSGNYDFEDIRPYFDHEVRTVVDSLLAGTDLSRAMAKFKFPRCYALLPVVTTRLVQLALRHELRHVHTIGDVQIIIEKYLDRLIEATASSLTHSGLEMLSVDKPYLFISNHRDITMDPALVNYMLYHHGFDTVQIAIGDNLLKRPFLSDLMRLNKSFIVKRSLYGREKFKASKQLSAYIHHCISNNENVWIAQREGRAKDGVDMTETAIVKMLHMADREIKPPKTLHESINALNIVPVSISYEFDPCDEHKARELYELDTRGTYEKDEQSDVQSILLGMVGFKGDVHVAFGSRLTVDDPVTADEVARLIDEHVVSNYTLHLMNYLAVEKLRPDFMDFSQLPAKFNVSPGFVDKKRVQFEKRLAAMSEELHPYVLKMYANPVLRQAEVNRTPVDATWKSAKQTA